MKSEAILKYVPIRDVKEKRIISSRRPPMQYFGLYFCIVLSMLLLIGGMYFTDLLLYMAIMYAVPLVLFWMYHVYSGHYRFLTENGLYIARYGHVLHIPWAAVDRVEAVFSERAFHQLRFIFTPGILNKIAGGSAGLAENDNALPCTGKALRCVRRHVPVTAEPCQCIEGRTKRMPESGQRREEHAGDDGMEGGRTLHQIPLREIKGKRFGRSGLLPNIYLYLYNIFVCSQAGNAGRLGIPGVFIYLAAVYALPFLMWWLYALKVHGGYRLLLTESGLYAARRGQAWPIPWEAVIRAEVTVRGSLNIKQRFVLSPEMAEAVVRQMPGFPDKGIALHYSWAALCCILRHVPTEVMEG